MGFNPAEAEEGFRSSLKMEATIVFLGSFNPAEAEEGFRSEKDILGESLVSGFNPAEAEEGFRRR